MTNPMRDAQYGIQSGMDNPIRSLLGATDPGAETAYRTQWRLNLLQNELPELDSAAALALANSDLADDALVSGAAGAVRLEEMQNYAVNLGTKPVDQQRAEWEKMSDERRRLYTSAGYTPPDEQARHEAEQSGPLVGLIEGAGDAFGWMKGAVVGGGGKLLEGLSWANDQIAGRPWRAQSDMQGDQALSRDVLRLRQARQELEADGIALTDEQWLSMFKRHYDTYSYTYRSTGSGAMDDPLSIDPKSPFNEWSDVNPFASNPDVAVPEEVWAQFDARAQELARDENFEISWSTSWDRVQDGSKFIPASVQIEAQNLLGGQDSEAFDLAVHRAKGGDLESWVRDVEGIDETSPEFEQRISMLAASYVGDPEGGNLNELQQAWNDAVELMAADGTKISLGRDFADMVGVQRDTKAFTALSGSVDALHVMTFDPTLVGGRAVKGIKGLRWATGVDDVVETHRLARVARVLRKNPTAVSDRGLLVMRDADDVVRRSVSLSGTTRTWVTAEARNRGLQWADLIDEAGRPTDFLAENYDNVRLVLADAKRSALASADEGGAARSMFETTALELDDATKVLDQWVVKESSGLRSGIEKIRMRDAAKMDEAAELIADAVRTGDYYELQRRLPHTVRGIDALEDYDRMLRSVRGVGVQDADDIWDFYRSVDGWMSLSAGKLTPSYLGEAVVTLPRLSRGRQAVRWATTSAERKIIDWGATVPDDVGWVRTKLGAPKRATSRLLFGISHQRPLGSTIPVIGDDAIVEFRKLLDMGGLAGMPEAVRKGYFNDFASALRAADAGEGVVSIGQRMTVVRGFLDDLFKRTGMYSDDKTAEWARKQLHLLDEHRYAPGDLDIVRAGSASKRVPILPVSQWSAQIAVPEFTEFIAQASRLTTHGKVLGLANHRFIDAAMGVWKPAILLRAGFIPRAAGEEMLGFLSGFGLRGVESMLADAAVSERRGLAQVAAGFVTVPARRLGRADDAMRATFDELVDEATPLLGKRKAAEFEVRRAGAKVRAYRYAEARRYSSVGDWADNVARMYGFTPNRVDHIGFWAQWHAAQVTDAFKQFRFGLVAPTRQRAALALSGTDLPLHDQLRAMYETASGLNDASMRLFRTALAQDAFASHVSGVGHWLDDSMDSTPEASQVVTLGSSRRAARENPVHLELRPTGEFAEYTRADKPDEALMKLAYMLDQIGADPVALAGLDAIAGIVPDDVVGAASHILANNPYGAQIRVVTPDAPSGAPVAGEMGRDGVETAVQGGDELARIDRRLDDLAGRIDGMADDDPARAALLDEIDAIEDRRRRLTAPADLQPPTRWRPDADAPNRPRDLDARPLTDDEQEWVDLAFEPNVRQIAEWGDINGQPIQPGWGRQDRGTERFYYWADDQGEIQGFLHVEHQSGVSEALRVGDGWHIRWVKVHPAYRAGRDAGMADDLYDMAKADGIDVEALSDRNDALGQLMADGQRLRDNRRSRIATRHADPATGEIPEWGEDLQSRDLADLSARGQASIPQPPESIRTAAERLEMVQSRLDAAQRRLDATDAAARRAESGIDDVDLTEAQARQAEAEALRAEVQGLTAERDELAAAADADRVQGLADDADVTPFDEPVDPDQFDADRDEQLRLLNQLQSEIQGRVVPRERGRGALSGRVAADPNNVLDDDEVDALLDQLDRAVARRQQLYRVLGEERARLQAEGGEWLSTPPQRRIPVIDETSGKQAVGPDGKPLFSYADVAPIDGLTPQQMDGLAYLWAKGKIDPRHPAHAEHIDALRNYGIVDPDTGVLWRRDQAPARVQQRMHRHDDALDASAHYTPEQVPSDPAYQEAALGEQLREWRQLRNQQVPVDRGPFEDLTGNPEAGIDSLSEEINQLQLRLDEQGVAVGSAAPWPVMPDDFPDASPYWSSSDRQLLHKALQSDDVIIDKVRPMSPERAESLAAEAPDLLPDHLMRRLEAAAPDSAFEQLVMRALDVHRRTGSRHMIDQLDAVFSLDRGLAQAIAGDTPLRILDDVARRAHLERSLRQALQSPEWEPWVRDHQRAIDVNGSAVVNPPEEHMRSFYGVMVDQAFVDQVADAWRQGPEALQTLLLTNINDDRARSVVARMIAEWDDEAQDLFLAGNQAAGVQSSLTPFTSMSFASYDDARLVADALRGVPGSRAHVGWRRLQDQAHVQDPMRALLAAEEVDDVGVEGVRMFRMGNHQQVHLQAFDETRPTQRFGDHVVQGDTYEAAIADWSVKLADLLDYQLLNRGELLHEVIEPMRRGTFGIDVMHSMDVTRLPEKFIAPSRFAVPSNWYQRLVRRGFDEVIGPAISALVRRPRFLMNLATGLDGAEQVVGLLRRQHLYDAGTAAARNAGFTLDDLRTLWHQLPDHMGDPAIIAKGSFGARVHNVDLFRAALREHPDVHYAVRLSALDDDDLDAVRKMLVHDEHVENTLMMVGVQRAVTDTVPYIDDHTVRSFFQDKVRNVVPFQFAQEAFLKRWARTLVHSPEAIRRAQLLAEGFLDSGFVHENQYGDKVFTIPGSAEFQRMLLRTPVLDNVWGNGVAVPIDVPLGGQVDAMLPGIPGDLAELPALSPVVQLPVNMAGMHFAEVRALEELYLGERANWNRSVWDTVFPGWATRTVQGLFGSMPEATMTSGMVGAMRMMEAEAIRLDLEAEEAEEAGDLDRARELKERAAELRIPDDADEFTVDAYLDEVRNWTRSVVFARGVFGFFSPASPQAEFEQPPGVNDDLLALMEHMPFDEALGVYLSSHPDAGPHTIFATEKATGAALPATAEALDFLEANGDWLDQFPLAGAYLLPQRRANDEFDRRAYDEYLAMELRRRRSPKEWVMAYKFSAAADDYFASRDTYLAARMEAEMAGDDARIRQLDLGWEDWATRYKLAKPLFASQLTGQASVDREATIKELSLALARRTDPATGEVEYLSAPDVAHRDQLAMLIDGYERYSTEMTMMQGDRRKAARDRRKQLTAGFSSWGEQFIVDHPEMAMVWRSLIEPAAGLRDERVAMEMVTNEQGAA